MNDAPLRTDHQLGEGFAFFRWHCLRFPNVWCKGFGDPCNACDEWWIAGRR